MAVKQLGKKGVFLTFISIAIIAAIIIIFTPSDINLKKDTTAIETRVTKVDDYVFDLENVYLEDTLKAIGRRTIIALIEYMEEQTVTSGAPFFLADFEEDFTQVLLNGKVYDPIGMAFVDIDFFLGSPFMTGNTFNDFLDEIKNTAADTLNVDTDFKAIQPVDEDEGVPVYIPFYTPPNIRITQDVSPWFLNVEADINFTLTSTEGTATWVRAFTVKTKIPIENFIDPLYLINTALGTPYENKIRKSGTTLEEWDFEKVKDFIRDGNYTNFGLGSDAPSFFMRMEGITTSSDCCSIESIVNINNPEIDDQATTFFDYQYWSTTPDCLGQDLYENTEINAEFSFTKFYNYQLVKYNILPDSIQVCP